MNSLILQKQEEVIALAQFDIKDAVLKKCLLKEDETVITVPDGVTTIGKDALCGLQSVIAVTLPESLKVINNGAFYGCSSLTSVTLPGSVERLGSCAFAQCSALNKIYLDNKLTEIGNSAFWGCTSLESIDIPSGVTKIGYNLFGSCLSLISVSLPDTVTELDERAFKECTSLACITLPDSLIKIGNMAFLNCHNLKSVNIPDRLESIGEKAFFMCESLHELEIPDGIASVGGDAFSDCVSVTVRSTISGKPLYKAVTATDGSSAYNFILRNIWDKGGFDFTAQDNYFPALQDENLQYAIAFSRLMYRVNLSASAEEHYLDFLHNNAENAVRYCITQDSAELLGICKENGLITAGNVTGLIEFADEQGNTSAAAFLLTVANSPEHDNFCDTLSSLEL